MENNSLSNKSKAIALFKWTNRKYLSVSIAYWILLFLAYPLAEIFIMITSIPVDGQLSGKQKNIVLFKVCLSYIFNIDACYSYWFNRYDFIVCT